MHRRTEDLNVDTLRGTLSKSRLQMFSFLQLKLRRRHLIADFESSITRPPAD